MSQRAFHAAALFTSNLLFRATSSHAFAPPPLLRPPSVFDGIPSQNRAAFHTSMRSTARQDQHDEARGGEWPRVLVVARRQTRKNKFVDFVGEYHISLLQESGACPILIPRTDGTLKQLEAYLYGGVDGLLVMEGADIGPQHNPYGPGPTELTDELVSSVNSKHESDVEIDAAKDSIEMTLVKELVLKRGVPYLGLCRGSQLLNVAMGGTLYFDIATETGSTIPHIDYQNYDGHRHALSVRPDTPLSGWFREQFQGLPATADARLNVNSYHHQGVKHLAPGLLPMCFADDGMIEGFFDPRHFDPSRGTFRVGLQWHPERMLDDYPGCRRVYETFVLAAAAHRHNEERKHSVQEAERFAPSAFRSRIVKWIMPTRPMRDNHTTIGHRMIHPAPTPPGI
ncbi:peptidase C26-domain-containing protein [Baffinella frigidus]|nr:peptidase C26-domain-containing protein [Cryptophyta sp. CCMP2293]